MRAKILFALMVFASLFMSPFNAMAEDGFDHSAWSDIVTEYVDESGLVDYQGLKANRQDFDAYVERIETISPASHPEQFPDEASELAYYMNAYNALVFKGVLKRGPEKKSVWRGLISGYNFFVKMKIKVGGDVTNLKKLEDDIIREKYKDPRIHAAINCASISCPRLLRTAFTGADLEEQLDSVMHEFVNSEAHVKIDASNNSVRISKIFDWFDKDFLEYEAAQNNSSPSLLDYINRYRETPIPKEYKVRFLSYNKNINDQK